jgi:glycosyltransferase involved in cell wall biosynthesis
MTLDILKDFAEQMSFPVKLHVNPNRLGSTRNFELALRACRGDIIFLCDQDDVWYPEKIALSEERLINDTASGAVFTNADLVKQDLSPYGSQLWESLRFHPREQAAVANGNAFSLLMKHFAVTGTTMAFRAKYLDLLLPIPDGWLHDAWIALLISATSNLSILFTPTVAYRQHSSNQYGAQRRRKHNEGKKLAEIYTPQALLYKKALIRLLEFSEKIPNIEDKIHQLEEKVHFLYGRAGFPDKRWHRIPYVLRNLISLRYHHYGRGLIPFVNDLAR